MQGEHAPSGTTSSRETISTLHGLSLKAISTRRGSSREDINQCKDGHETWSQDIWNRHLWDRVTDVNSSRTNIYVSRPRESGLGRICTKFSYIDDKSLINNHNLRDYSLEAQLHRINIFNNRDCVGTTKENLPCIYENGEGQQNLNQKQSNTSAIFDGQATYRRDNCWRRTTFGQPTSERFNTVDPRIHFIECTRE